MFLITGSSGQLAQEFQKYFRRKRINFTAPPETQLDITDFKKTQSLVTKIRPRVILNCAAYNLVEEAQKKPSDAFKVNALAVGHLARLCRAHKIFLVHYSTDYVFDGKKGGVYTEKDKPHPVNQYGAGKWQGEKAVQRHLKEYLIFRLSWVFGCGRQNFLSKIAQWAKTDKTLKINADEVSVPTYTEDVVKVTMLALKKKLKGLYHLTNSGRASRYEFAKYFIQKMGLNNTVIPVSSDYFPAKVKRPIFSAMSNKRISGILNISIPAWENAVDRFVKGQRDR